MLILSDVCRFSTRVITKPVEFIRKRRAGDIVTDAIIIQSFEDSSKLADVPGTSVHFGSTELEREQRLISFKQAEVEPEPEVV